MLRWFRRHAEGVFDVEDVIDRSRELAGFIGAARNHYGLGDRKLIAVGFSNGANIALATGHAAPGSPGPGDRALRHVCRWGSAPAPAALTGAAYLPSTASRTPWPRPPASPLIAELARAGSPPSRDSSAPQQSRHRTLRTWTPPVTG